MFSYLLLHATQKFLTSSLLVLPKPTKPGFGGFVAMLLGSSRKILVLISG